MTDGGRFWCLVIGLAMLPGCVHTPSPEDPARCALGASVSHSRGRSFGEPTEDVTVTAWSSCDL